MASDTPTPDFSRLIRFSEGLNTLDDAAWDRVATRCGLLDLRSVSGFLGRVELFARSVMPDANPYTQPGARPAMAAMGTVFGILGEIALLLGGPSPDRYETESARLRQRGAEDRHAAGTASFLAILGHAARQRPRHPGVSAALQAVAMALLVSPHADRNIQDVYGPFEPEIPFASIQPSEAYAV